MKPHSNKEQLYSLLWSALAQRPPKSVMALVDQNIKHNPLYQWNCDSIDYLTKWTRNIQHSLSKLSEWLQRIICIAYIPSNHGPEWSISTMIFVSDEKKIVEHGSISVRLLKNPQSKYQYWGGVENWPHQWTLENHNRLCDLINPPTYSPYFCPRSVLIKHKMLWKRIQIVIPTDSRASTAMPVELDFENRFKSDWVKRVCIILIEPTLKKLHYVTIHLLK